MDSLQEPMAHWRVATEKDTLLCSWNRWNLYEGRFWFGKCREKNPVPAESLPAALQASLLLHSPGNQGEVSRDASQIAFQMVTSLLKSLWTPLLKIYLQSKGATAQARSHWDKNELHALSIILHHWATSSVPFSIREMAEYGGHLVRVVHHGCDPWGSLALAIQPPVEKAGVTFSTQVLI